MKRLIILRILIILIPSHSMAQFNTIMSSPFHKKYRTDSSQSRDSSAIISDSVESDLKTADSSLFCESSVSRENEISMPAVSLSLPINGDLIVTSRYGRRLHPTLGRIIMHSGVDLRCRYDVVKSVANGIIEREGYDRRSGNYLVIQHRNGIESIYCHLSRIILHKGDSVLSGNIVAISGATGAATGPHLHFGIKIDGKAVNPLPFLRAVEDINKRKSLKAMASN